MKNLFQIAVVALALTTFTACGNEEAATEAEVTETEVVETEVPATEEVEAPATEEVVETPAADSTVVVE